MVLLLATGNAHKVKEVQAILGDMATVVSMKDMGLDVHIEEDGDTFGQNALKKAEGLLPYAGDVDGVIADDSGLCVDALDGAPGVYSARYAGEGATDARNNAKLLGALEGVPEDKRTARFVSAVALVRHGKPPQVFEGICEGRVLDAPRGSGGFGYDPLFLPQGYNETFGEMQSITKNRISHRFKALAELRDALV